MIESRDYHNEIKAERDALRASLELFENTIVRAIGGNDYLDPPDGGDVPLPEQVQRMRAERDALREALKMARNALKPFKFEAKAYDPPENDDDFLLWGEHYITVGHLRNARDAIEKIDKLIGGEIGN